MAESNQESYWRIYLLLHEGSPLIFKQLIAREIEKCGDDLDSILLDNKAKLSEDLSTLEVAILFPESKKTDIDKWSSGIFPSVISTLFGKTLEQVTKQLIKRIQNVHDDIEGLPEMSLDYDAYDDLEQTLSKTLQKLSRLYDNEMEMVAKIDELIQVFLKQPLDIVDLLGKIKMFNMPNETRQDLRVFLEAHAKNENTSERTPDAQTSVKVEERGLYKYGSSRKSANVSVETRVSLDETGKLEEAANGSDEIYDGSEHVTTHIIKDVSRYAGVLKSRLLNWLRGHTEQQGESPRLLYQTTDFRGNISAKRVDDMVSYKLEDLENMTVKVAVLGRTGVGKSRFINAIRGCTSKEDPLYAEVGPIESTSKAECYPHPKNKQLELYDLPGIRSPNFDEENFLIDKRINFYSYDIYIIMASDRFTTDEVFFVDRLKRSGKTFLFVRSRVDINLDDTDDEKAYIDKMRADCKKNLSSLRIKETDVFLISSKQLDHQLLDFDRLLERLVYSLSGLKKDAMLFSLQFNTTKIISDKKAALEKRILVVCAAYFAAGRIDTHVVLCDILIVRELDLYRKTLCVTDNNLKDLAAITKTNIDELKKTYQLNSFDMYNDTREANTGVRFADILKTHTLPNYMESSLRAMCSDCSPGVSLAITISTACILKIYLDFFVKDAKTIMDIHVKEIGIKVLGLK